MALGAREGRGGRRAPSPVYAYRGGRPGFGFRPERPSSRCRQPCSPVWTQSAPRALCPRSRYAPAGACAGRGDGISPRAAAPPRRAASARCPPRPRARPSPRPRDTRGDSNRSPSARRQTRPAGPLLLQRAHEADGVVVRVQHNVTRAGAPPGGDGVVREVHGEDAELLQAPVLAKVGRVQHDEREPTPLASVLKLKGEHPYLPSTWLAGAGEKRSSHSTTANLRERLSPSISATEK